MDYILASEGFKKMFRLLSEDHNKLHHLHQVIKEAVGCVADDLYLGKLKAAINIAPSVQDSKGYQETFTYVHPEWSFRENGECIERRFAVVNGAVDLWAYPADSHQWDDREKEDVIFLLETIYILASRMRIFEWVAKAAVTDSTTSAVNQVGFMQHGAKLFAQKKLAGYIVLFMNLRNFKFVNQSVGQRKGNEVLRKYHFAVETHMNEKEGEIFSRFGGDNFVALVKRERITGFLDFISDVEVSVDTGEEEKSFAIGARMGIYDIQRGDTITKALDCASAALLVSRRDRKRSYVWFEHEMLEDTLREKEIVSIFPDAMKKKEFVVYYQPKVQIFEKKLYGAEALVRWIRDGKVIAPAQFIPVLEKDGSVCDLDFYMFACVCEDISKWLEEGIEPVRISVNFSKLHLRNPNFVDGLITILQLYELDGKYLEIELTEMTGYDDFETLVEVVGQLKEYGITTSIDDFGSGYSSLGLLKDLDVDIIKLDKSFIDNLGHSDRNDEIIVRNVVKMISDLNKEAVAEGVETEEQAEFLKNVKCQVVQGYLFDKPLQKEEFKKRLLAPDTFYK